MSDIELSIIIPTYNRHARLARVLSALEGQSYPLRNFEVIVISDGSTDDTDQFLSDCQPAFQLTPVFQENQGVAVARNTGIQHARAGWILFLDDDVCPSAELVSQHVDWLKRYEKVVVLGPMLTPPEVRLQPWVLYEQMMLEKQYQNMLSGEWVPTARQFYTGNTSLEKRSIEQAGCFDPSFSRAEDVDLAYRLNNLNVRFLFNPKAIGYHYAERSFDNWMDIAYTYGRNDVIMTQKKKQNWLLPQVFLEYTQRNFLVRMLTGLCLDHQRFQSGCIAALKRMGLSADRENQQKLARYCFSGIYNLRYYQGISDSLGGREVFYRYLQDVKLYGS